MIDAAIFAMVAALRTTDPSPIDFKQVECLADAVYFEARGEPLAAQIGVASVVVARGSPCDVVRKPRQFAYRKLRDRKRADGKAWAQAAEVAVLVASGAVRPIEATHFHDTSQTPAWTARMKYVGQAGSMKFWRGK